MSQIDYYNRFGQQHAASILACPEPELWTTDYDHRGKIYCGMKERVGIQLDLVNRYFDRHAPVLDIGCGFGRQALLLAKHGYSVTGVDTSPAFVDLATRLHAKHGGSCSFVRADVLAGELAGQFQQIMLLDVFEHVPPRSRRVLVQRLVDLTPAGAMLLLSLPLVSTRPLAVLDNLVRRRITQRFAYFVDREEHPYPIPGKRQVARLLRPFFQLLHYAEAGDVAFYVLRREAKKT